MALRRALLLLLGGALLALSVPACASALNVTGTWNANYHCEAGWCAGSDFPAPGVVFEQAKGSDVVTAPCGCFSGTLSGNVLTANGEEGSYTYHEVLTFAPDGKSWSGSLSDSHETSGTDTGVKVSGPEEGRVSGYVKDEHEKGVEGVKVQLSGKNDEEKEVSAEQTTGASGVYFFEIEPGTYKVKVSGEPKDRNGGTLDVKKTAGGGKACDGTPAEASCALKHVGGGEEVTADFTYQDCGASARLVNGKEPTGCPIIFVPGILGSRLFCNTGELFLSLANGSDFGQMQLEPNGETNAGAPGSCEESAFVPKGPEGLLSNVGGTTVGEDFYGGIYNYLKSIAENGIYAYPYDWRQGVPSASKGLATLVDEALEQTGAKHVVIVAHSMGGLVSEQYVVESGGEKVTRVLTVGTPYWGAPKSMISLMNGLTNEFVAEKPDWLLFKKEDVQLAARNFSGLFWLYPSAAFGPWLQVSGAKGVPSHEVGGNDVAPWVAALKGNTQLLARAEAGHASLDGFKPGEVDYQIVAGVGLPTIVSMSLNVNELEPEQWGTATYSSGDGTVPARSQTQGAFPDHESGKVKIHYMCGVGHSAEPASPKFQGKIKEFVLSGGNISSEESCPFGGDEIVAFGTKILTVGKASAAATPSDGAMTVQEAANKGLIQALELGDRTVIVSNDRNPVKLKISGQHLSLRIRPIENNGGGAPVYYGPVNGTITIAGSTVAQGSRKLKPAKRSGAPHAIARIRRHGKHYLVRLLVTGKVKGGTIRYRIGNAAPKTYGKPLLLTRAQLKKLRFGAVSSFGVFQKVQRARLPR
jgi:pimeloyl-ACP methyl ester carboxylesterase